MLAFCYFAWYQANANAGIAFKSSTTGNLTTKGSTLDVRNYQINFGVSLNKSQLELSHVADEDEGTADEVGGATVASLSEGDLVYGGIYDGDVQVKKVASDDKGNFITTYTITASWQSAPTDPAEIAYFNGATFTATITATAQAFFCANAISGLTNSETATCTVTISYDANAVGEKWSFVASAYSPAGIHVEPTDVDDEETGTTGSIAVTAVAGLTPAA